LVEIRIPKLKAPTSHVQRGVLCVDPWFWLEWPASNDLSRELEKESRIIEDCYFQSLKSTKPHITVSPPKSNTQILGIENREEEKPQDFELGAPWVYILQKTI
jgi:hypothetical protein